MEIVDFIFDKMINSVKEKYSIIKKQFLYKPNYDSGSLMRNKDLSNCYVDDDDKRIWLKKPTTFKANVLGFVKLSFTYCIEYAYRRLGGRKGFMDLFDLLKLPTTYVLKHKGKPILLSNNKDYKSIHKINVTGNDEWIDVTLHDSINNNEPLNIMALIDKLNETVAFRNAMLLNKLANIINVIPFNDDNKHNFLLFDIYIDVEWQHL